MPPVHSEDSEERLPPERIEGDTEPEPLRVVPARLPARLRGFPGITRLRVRVSAEGTATRVDIVGKSGEDQADEAARSAVRRWTFTPAFRGGEPVEGEIEVEFGFDEGDDAPF